MSLDNAEVENRLGAAQFTKYNAFISANDITEQEFSELTVRMLKVEAASNTAEPPHVNPVISTIKLWAVSPLNLTNASFAKALENE